MNDEESEEDEVLSPNEIKEYSRRKIVVQTIFKQKFNSFSKNTASSIFVPKKELKCGCVQMKTDRYVVTHIYIVYYKY